MSKVPQEGLENTKPNKACPLPTRKSPIEDLDLCTMNELSW